MKTKVYSPEYIYTKEKKDSCWCRASDVAILERELARSDSDARDKDSYSVMTPAGICQFYTTKQVQEFMRYGTAEGTLGYLKRSGIVSRRRGRILMWPVKEVDKLINATV